WTQVARLGPNRTECLSRSNVVGQTGGLRAGGDVLSNYTAVPEWSGNLFGTYRKGPWAVTAQARYTGSAQGSMFWIGPDDPKFAPESWFTISKNRMPSWVTWNATVNYDFGRSRAMPASMEALRLSLRIENLFDKQPNFWSGAHIAGVNTRYLNGTGRTFPLQHQTEFCARAARARGVRPGAAAGGAGGAGGRCAVTSRGGRARRILRAKSSSLARSSCRHGLRSPYCGHGGSAILR